MSAQWKKDQGIHPWCKICLVSNVRMCSIENNHLLEMYMKLTNTQPKRAHGMPRALCYICYSQLQKASKFSTMAQKSQKILDDLHQQGIEAHNIVMMSDCGSTLLSMSNISFTTIPSYSNNRNAQVPETHTVVKKEPMCDMELIKEEDISSILEENKIIGNLIDCTHRLYTNDDPIDESSPVNTKLFIEITNNEILHEKKSKSYDKYVKNDKQLHKPYVCNMCHKTFNQKINLQSHMRTHPGEKPFKCKMCNKTYSRKGHLQSHIKTHSGDKPYVCDICNKAFREKSVLTNHIKTHTGEKLYECKTCNKTFFSKQNLQNHLRNHTGEKAYACKICHRPFKLKSYLQSHIRIHTGEKPFKCNLCHKTFTHKPTLQSHIRTHTGEKPHVCNICNKAFNKKSNMHTHIKTQHSK